MTPPSRAPKRGLWRTLKRSLWGSFSDRVLFNVAVREHECRQEFFYNAFRALKFNGISGDYLEFGCWGARTFALAHHEAKRHGHTAHMWAFDSFEGLPPPRDSKDAHPVWTQGNLAMSLDSFHSTCVANGVPRSAYTTVPGFYEQSLSALTNPPADLALVYIDCDMYSSTVTVLDFLAPRLKHGMIVAFDDWHCWSATQQSGERRALLEFQARDTRFHWVEYMRYGWAGNSFVLEDRSLTTGVLTAPRDPQ